MPTIEHREELSTAQPSTVVHPLAAKDAAAVTAMRAIIEPHRGELQGTRARRPFDAIMERVSGAEGVTYEHGSVGGIAGWWSRPRSARDGQVLLYLHGGWFNWGSAHAYRNFVGHLATRAGAVAFAPDYRLAPEHPFPAAFIDVQAAYRGLVQGGAKRVAIVGDSAGGALALGLLSLTHSGLFAGPPPVGAALLSPVTDLSMGGESWNMNATSDIYFTREQATALIDAYLDGQAASDPQASPLFGDFSGLPPMRVHVGGDEMLLDDSRRAVERAVAVGVDARLEVWKGMQHVFQSGIGVLAAAEDSVHAIGVFLAARLQA